jgi:hypothetical protein
MAPEQIVSDLSGMDLEQVVGLPLAALAMELLNELKQLTGEGVYVLPALPRSATGTTTCPKSARKVG